MKIQVALASAVMLLGTLAACGSDGDSQDSSYCRELKRSEPSISGVADAVDLVWEDDTLPSIHALAAKSPDDLAAEWKILDAAFSKFEDGLNAAGLKQSDMNTFRGPEDTSKIDPAAWKKIKRSITGLASSDVSKAWDAVVANAKDVCKVELD